MLRKLLGMDHKLLCQNNHLLEEVWYCSTVNLSVLVHRQYHFVKRYQTKLVIAIINNFTKPPDGLQQILSFRKTPHVEINVCDGKVGINWEFVAAVLTKWEPLLTGECVASECTGEVTVNTQNVTSHCACVNMDMISSQHVSAGTMSQPAAFRPEQGVGLIQLPPHYLSSPSAPVPFSLFSFEEKWHIWVSSHLQVLGWIKKTVIHFKRTNMAQPQSICLLSIACLKIRLTSEKRMIMYSKFSESWPLSFTVQ